MDNRDRDQADRGRFSVLGDIDPKRHSSELDREEAENPESDEPMEGGSRHDRSHHPGSRDVTEGVTGGTGTEVGGSRNYRQGSGATGGDIGNRPE